MATQVLENGYTLLDSFPFDSSPNLVFTDQGYPRGDRSVDAWTMQRTFRQFFTNGVFGTPGDAWQITNPNSGMNVAIQPGMAVIEGAMGGVKESDGPLVVQLDTNPAHGNVAYGIMLRYDNNSATRGLCIRVAKGIAGSTPIPPTPDTTSAGVYELRLGYVVVPNGSSDLSSAQIVNEKGLAVCPYASPFVPLDVSGIVADFRVAADQLVDTFSNNLDIKNASAQQMLANFLVFLDQYEDFVQSAVDGTTAGNLQNQITDIKEQLGDLNFSTAVDNETIAYSRKPDDVTETLHVMDYGIGTVQIADNAVDEDKIADSSVHIRHISNDAVDVHGGLASFDAMSDVSSDLFKIAHQFHMTQLDGLDLDTIIEWTFPDDATAQHGQWNSGGYYYADGGVA